MMSTGSHIDSNPDRSALYTKPTHRLGDDANTGDVVPVTVLAVLVVDRLLGTLSEEGVVEDSGESGHCGGVVVSGEAKDLMG